MTTKVNIGRGKVQAVENIKKDPVMAIEIEEQVREKAGLKPLTDEEKRDIIMSAFTEEELREIISEAKQ